jgi:preprotein translocase subunit YajC
MVVRVHSQTIAKVVDDATGTATADGAPRSVEEAMAIANREAAEREAAAAKDAAEPQYGERVDESGAEAKKPVRRTTKKTAE